MTEMGIFKFFGELDVNKFKLHERISAMLKFTFI